MNCFRAGAKLPVERITQKNMRKEHHMDYRPDDASDAEETCVICREAPVDIFYGVACCEYWLPGDPTPQEYLLFIGMCDKCIAEDGAMEIFEIILGIYNGMLRME